SEHIKPLTPSCQQVFIGNFSNRSQYIGKVYFFANSGLKITALLHRVKRSNVRGDTPTSAPFAFDRGRKHQAGSYILIDKE
ncbi:MAG: hypothetical protein ACLFSY_10625, partial [Desulfonatronovibrionaceae bacterium]